MGIHSEEGSGNPSFGGIIRKRRESMGLTQKQLAAAVGNCSAKTISQYENGKCPAEVETYFSLAEALRVTPNDLAPRRLMENAASGMGDYARLNDTYQRIVDQFIGVVLETQNGDAQVQGTQNGQERPPDAPSIRDTGDTADTDGENTAE